MARNPKQNIANQAAFSTTATTPVVLVETSAVLLLIAAPTLARVACWIVWGNDYLEYDKRLDDLEFKSFLGFAVHLVWSVFSSLRWVPIVLFVIWRSGDGWARFGLVKPKWGRDILIGISLAFIIAVTDYAVRAALGGSHASLWWRMFPAAGKADRVFLCLVSACAIGFSEELVARAYLIPRLETLTGAAWKSVLLSAVIFGLLHLQKGFGGVVHSMLSAGVWGTGFCMTRRIWPVAISHALTDFVVETHLTHLISIVGP